MDRLGLSWTLMQELNPRIIYASISGFGHTGPWRDRRSFDPIAQATSGYMWLMKDAINPDGPPLQAPDAIADTIPGLVCLIGILAALVSRSGTGKGQRVDVAQMDSMMANMQSFSFWNLVKSSFMSAGRAYRAGVSGLRKTRDGYVMFSVTPGRITDWFKELLDVEELEAETVDNWVANKTVNMVVDELEKIGVPVGAVMDLDEAQRSSQAVARQMFVEVEHPILGQIIEPGFPIKFSDTKGDISTPAPLLGEHNVEVFTDLLGLSDKRVEELRKRGVI
jgi:crotonobetainyl-CoA:carnitine CoA-transferase CaiB-like acyl-CoA transferase